MRSLRKLPGVRADVAVIGSGPAGAGAARLLASWGHKVVVVHRPVPSDRTLAESLPPSTTRLFEALGIRERVEEAGYYRSSGNTTWWAGREAQVEPFDRTAGAAGYQVNRADFDRHLRALAVEAGARIVGPWSVRSVRVTRDEARLACTGRRGALEVRARFVLDCSGRAGAIACRGLRRLEPGYRTIALGGFWKSPAGWHGHLRDPSQTLVESYRDGWAWSVPIAPTLRYVAVMIDPRLSPTRRGLTATYGRELEKAHAFGQMLRAADLVSPIRGHDASVYSAGSFADPPFLLVGDAGSFIDPLSSYGVKKALVSAWRAAVVVNTCLTSPASAAAAFELFSDREHQVFASSLVQARPYFREARDVYRHPFWADRAAAAEAGCGPAVDEPVERTLARDPQVLGAFARLRASARIDLRPDPRGRVERRPDIVGRQVVLEEFLVNDAVPTGVRFLGGVNLPALLAEAPAHDQVPDLFAAYTRRHGPATLPDFLGALSVLIAKGFLTNEARL